MTDRAQPYHHGNLRATLVRTAVDLARTSGPDGVVLREAARRAGVSHNAAYRHFSDRAELLAAVGEAAMAQLEASMRERIAAVPAGDPAGRAGQRLRETGRAYVQFALDEPGLFAVAFAGHDDAAAGSAGTEPEFAEAVPADAGPYGVLNAVLDELVECGVVSPERRHGADVACWSMVHGFADLVSRGPMRPVPAEQRAQLLEVVLDVVQQGLTA